MRLYLIRHPRPDVPDGVCYGSTDLPILAGHQQPVLAQLISALPSRVPVFSSPLRRCSALAAELACALDAGQPIFDARLAEMDFGTWEMNAWSAIPRMEIDAWAADLKAYRPGGGECLLEVARRVRSFHEELQAAKLNRAIVIGHAGTIRMLLVALRCTSLEEMVDLAAQTANQIAYGELIAINCKKINT